MIHDDLTTADTIEPDVSAWKQERDQALRYLRHSNAIQAPIHQESLFSWDALRSGVLLAIIVTGFVIAVFKRYGCPWIW